MKVKLLFPLLIAILLGLVPMDLTLQHAIQCVQIERTCEKGQTQIEAYEHILAVEPWRVELWEGLADQQLQQGDYPAALMSYQTALDAKILSISGRVNYGYALLHSGQTKAAQDWWLAMALEGTAPLDLYPVLYEQLMTDLRVEDAIHLINVWLANQPDDANLQLQAGVLALLTSHDSAREYFDRAAALDAALAPLTRSLKTAIDQAHLKDDPAYQQLLIGREAANQGFPLIAELLCAQAVQLNPAYAEAWAMLGELQQRNGRDGLAALEQALALDPQSLMVRSLLALYWQRQDDPAQAVAVFTQLAAEYPEQRMWQIELGKATAQAGDIPAGLQFLVDASNDAPQDSQVWTALANFCAQFRIELQTYGLAAAREALQLAPKDPAALLAMGNVLFILDDGESAARYYQRVLAIAPDEVNALYQLGVIALQEDRNQDAHYYFTRVLDLTPDYADLHATAARMLESLKGN